MRKAQSYSIVRHPSRRAANLKRINNSIASTMLFLVHPVTPKSTAQKRHRGSKSARFNPIAPLTPRLVSHVVADHPSLLPLATCYTRVNHLTLYLHQLFFFFYSVLNVKRESHHTKEEQERNESFCDACVGTNRVTGLQERSYSSQWKRFRLTPDLKRPSHWVQTERL